MTPRRASAVAVLACAAAVGGAGGAATARAAEGVRPPGSAGALGNERLSDEERLTRHAVALQRAPVRRRPSGAAPVVARLRYFSEDGPDEVYLVVASRVDRRGRTWLRIRVPQRPHPRTGWVLRRALGHFAVVRTKLEIDRRTLRARLLLDGRRIWSAPIGVGKPSTPTPRGRFWIRTRLRSLEGGGVYGPWAFGTSAYSVLTDWPGGGVVGIHGTDQPELIPGRPSHGCVRMSNHEIRRLARLMPIGTPVEIR